MRASNREKLGNKQLFGSHALGDKTPLKNIVTNFCAFKARLSPHREAELQAIVPCAVPFGSNRVTYADLTVP